MISVLFVPWPFSESGSGKAGSDLAGKNKIWIETRMKKNEKIKQANEKQFLSEGNGEIREVCEVWYSGKPIGLMGSLKATDQVYIRGHSLAGIECIFSPDNTVDYKNTDPTVRDALNPRGSDRTVKQGADCLYAKDVVARLAASGLKESFAGKLKCYNCHSCEGEKNFAQSFADAMYLAGYKSCKFYGYIGSLSSMPEINDGPFKGHKTSLVLKEKVSSYNQNKMITVDEVSRASANRVPVIPTPLKPQTKK